MKTYALTSDSGITPCTKAPTEKNQNQPFCTSNKFRSMLRSRNFLAHSEVVEFVENVGQACL